MKTAEEILCEYDYFFNSHGEKADDHVLSAMKEYAKLVAEKALEDAAENALINEVVAYPQTKEIKGRMFRTETVSASGVGAKTLSINKESILNTPVIIN